MTVCRHILHFGTVGYMTGTSVSTQARISTPFDRLDLSPCPGELLSLLPLDVYAAGYQGRVILGDCTENWIT